MFGKKGEPCMVYEYGCSEPLNGNDSMFNEMFLRNRYWNTLVEIDRAFSAKVAELLVVPDDPTVSVKDEIKQYREEIKQRHKRGKTGKIGCTDLQEQINRLKNELSLLYPELKEKRKRIREANKEKLKILDTERCDAIKQARKANGLYWGNYGDVEQSYKMARERLKPGQNLNFHRWNGDGKITVRYQYGLAVSDVFKCKDSRLQIEMVNKEAWLNPKRSIRRKHLQTKVRIRVRSDEKLKPVWVELPIYLHRPLPETSMIRSASIIRERIGRKFRYKLVITVTVPEEIPRVKWEKSGTIGIDIGWRLVPEADTSHVKLFLFSFFLNVNFSLFIKDFIVIFHPVYIQ